MVHNKPSPLNWSMKLDIAAKAFCYGYFQHLGDGLDCPFIFLYLILVKKHLNVRYGYSKTD